LNVFVHVCVINVNVHNDDDDDDDDDDLTPSISGRSPGALTSDSLIRLRTCVTERTVAATNHGRPSSEQTMMSSARTNKSRWYPKPFCTRTIRHHIETRNITTLVYHVQFLY